MVAGQTDDECWGRSRGEENAIGRTMVVEVTGGVWCVLLTSMVVRFDERTSGQ